MRALLLAAAVLASTPAAAQIAYDESRRALDAARLDQQRLSDQARQLETDALIDRLQTQRSLDRLQSARPPSPRVPDDYPAGGGVRRNARPSQATPPATTPGGTASSAPVVLPSSDAATRGDLPL